MKQKTKTIIAIAIGLTAVGVATYFGVEFCNRKKNNDFSDSNSGGLLEDVLEECCHGITNADRKLNEAGCPKKGCSLEQEIKKAMGKVDAPSKVRTYKETEPFSGERHSHTEVSFDIEKCSGDIYAQAENAI